MLNGIKDNIKRIYVKIRHLLKWSFFSILTGIIIGAFGTAFAKSLSFVTQFREDNPWIILLLPLAGCVIVYIYKVSHYEKDEGTNVVLSTVHAKAQIPFRMAPLIFISTIISHLFGASVGREGAALQMGGSLGNQLGRWFKFDENDKRILVSPFKNSEQSSLDDS